MIDVVFYFQVHQPYRLRKWKPDDRISRLDLFDEPLNRLVAERVAERCRRSVLVMPFERELGRAS